MPVQMTSRHQISSNHPGQGIVTGKYPGHEGHQHRKNHLKEYKLPTPKGKLHSAVNQFMASVNSALSDVRMQWVPRLVILNSPITCT